MLGVLGLLTGWVLLIPALVVVYLRLGGPPVPVLWPVITFAASVPMLAFSTIAGITLVVLSVRSLTRPSEPLAPPR
ncbi:MAG: hypothetical protein DCF16_09700 [Alphaproteobacteria bacterium]|nr:MAG: hypothetical protein DCF16_09700 [Alphaproteobacteria bacterium]